MSVASLISLTLKWSATRVQLNPAHIIKVDESLGGGSVVTTVEQNPDGSNKFYLVNESPQRVRSLCS